MTGQVEGAVGPCGTCGREMPKAHRVHEGVRYCGTCYARCFKRLLCGGCGMFKRLLAAEREPRCRSCRASLPCTRCLRRGRSVGLMTQYGPVCNSCRPHFVAEEPCEVCGCLSSRLTRVSGAFANKRACPKCAREGQRTCSSCRRHRPCTPQPDGSWVCAKCRDVGQVDCGECGRAMPAGRGVRCEDCYWDARLSRVTIQNIELLRGPDVRNAYSKFNEWLRLQGKAKTAVRFASRYVEFFAELDRADLREWSPTSLLRHFGAAGLRKNELPTRWLTSTGNLGAPSPTDKIESVEQRRIEQILLQVPVDTLAHKVVASFKARMLHRHDEGTLALRSVRASLLPAVALCRRGHPQWQQLPVQSDLDGMLKEVPGQRAALSAFVGYLNSEHGCSLRLPGKPTAGEPQMQKMLERRIAEFLITPAGQSDAEWTVLALRYFHRMSAADARRIASSAHVRDDGDGVELRYLGLNYWIPKPVGSGRPWRR